jgi:peptidoglycan hydrolase-like protein with peptidoglycan-binding domain
MNEEEIEVAEVVVDEPKPAAKPAAAKPEPTPEPEPEAKVEVPAEEPKPKAAVKSQAPAGSHVVSGNETDDVLLSACVYKNMYVRKSLSVHHVQRRLVELGYPDGGTDKDGWYGDLTKLAVSQFQKASGLAGDGLMDEPTLRALFQDDSNVTVKV